MNDNQGAKQQIAERIKSSSNILVTVNADPSVDQLAAALGLTIMLNNIAKHATAVFSGAVPPAISFLDPEKTFENSVDSLRDFIIALDKEKADHLRYKVDGDVVKIFITPYKTTLTSDDLDFSQGDYNVELVLALGVQNKDHLDAALSAHGRILHDATVATLSCGDAPSELGTIDWFEPNASSLSEMLVALSESLKGDKALLDEQSATALLTGIVAATDRFSNDKTSSKVMTMAAQLMAAGANQQLIAAKLEEAHEIGPEKASSPANSDGTTALAEGEATKLDASSGKKSKTADGSLSISHEKDGSVDDVANQVASQNGTSAAKAAEEELAEQLQGVAPAVTAPDLAYELTNEAATAKSGVLPPVAPAGEIEPTMGGTLNATTEQAHEDSEREALDNRNKTILSHGDSTYVGNQAAPTFAAPFNATSDTVSAEPKSVDIFDTSSPGGVSPADKAPTIQPMAATETLAQLEEKTREDQHADARADIAAALSAAPFEPANNPIASLGAQPLGEQPTLAPAPMPLPPAPAAVVPEPSLAPVEPAVSQLPPAPTLDFSVLPPPPPPPLPPVFDGQPHGPLPPDQLGQIFGSPTPTPVETPAPKDPNQFTIPGQ